MIADGRQQQAGFLEQQGEFEQIGDAVGLGDDAVGQRGGAIFAAQSVGGKEDVEFAAGLFAVVDVGGIERARSGDFCGQHGNPLNFGQGLVVGTAAGLGQQFGDAAGVDVGILPQIDRRQVEAENLHPAHQPAKSPAGQCGAAVQFQRVGEDLEVGTQCLRCRVGLGVADFVT